MPDSRAFRQFMACFATGITVVTVKDAKKNPIGLTINSLASVSLDPQLVLFCLDKKAHVYPAFRRAKNFAINILADGQKDVSRHFADYRNNPEPKKIWDKPQQGCPILKHTLGWMVCRTVNVYRGGDHDIFVGEVVKLKKKSGEAEPLLYFRSRYRDIGQ